LEKGWEINQEYLIEKCRDTKCTISKTPNGLADSVIELNDEKQVFSLPYEDELGTLKGFFETSKSCRASQYIQKQCDSLRTDFPFLMDDIEELEWAKSAFGQKPDAVNLWIGHSDSTSSLHKDHYENIYCTITGRKHFTLLHPTDAPFLYRKEFPVFKYDSDLQLHDTGTKVPWIPLDPDAVDLEKYPLFKHATPFHVTLNPSDLMYLPSLWYHKVKQDDDTIAINFWYDMHYNANYALSTLLESKSFFEQS
jgi:peptidyl-lysine (3S)-dioxygenase / protease